MNSGYFYSKSAGLYVSRTPLKIDARVKKAAGGLGLRLTWNDEGSINFIDFNQSRLLLGEIGAIMMSPTEYWQVYFDAQEEGDIEMVQSLMSHNFCEWLDRVYTIDGYYIDNPVIGKNYNYNGQKILQGQPLATPGWFVPENNINASTGHPEKVKLHREKKSSSWKYWSPDFSVTKNRPRAPIRGYVTSVGKPSFDLGIPVDATQPMQMVRECRRKPLSPLVPPEISNRALILLSEYERYLAEPNNLSKYTKMLEKENEVLAFFSKHSTLFSQSKDPLIYKIRERVFDVLGMYSALRPKLSLKNLGFALSRRSNNCVNINDLASFVRNSRERVTQSLYGKKDIVFVMGHKNPDSDTVVSSVFEAYRNHLIDGENITYIPIVQYFKIPEEIRELLGADLADSLILSGDPLYKKILKTGLARWILVDQNREPEVQKYLISIIDHHIISQVAKSQDLPKTMEWVGSCASLIVQKMLGMGLTFDKSVAKILYGATLMDTENRVEHKMTLKDEVLMDYLKKQSGVEDDSKYYSHLMSFLLNTDDPALLFKRDYKEDWGFGFAVAKIKGGFGEGGVVLNKKLISHVIEIGNKNNADKHLPLTMIKITDYLSDNINVNRERIYLLFSPKARTEFKEAIYEVLGRIIRFEFNGVSMDRGENYIDFWGTGMQLSRKKTVPLLEPLVGSYNEYFYSESLKLFVRRDFLRKTKDVMSAAKSTGLKISTDEQGRLNYLTFEEAKELCTSLGYSMLSVKDYWRVLDEAKNISDYTMINSLQGSNFVEFWDTAILDSRLIIQHPALKGGKRIRISGTKKILSVPHGKPGLIDPKDINLNSGFPRKVMGPDKYGVPELWRYWEPDASVVVPTRSYIFLLDQPSFDCKFHLGESFPNLGIRPCAKEVALPKIALRESGKQLVMTIKKEGDSIKYIYKR